MQEEQRVNGPTENGTKDSTPNADGVTANQPARRGVAGVARSLPKRPANTLTPAVSTETPIVNREAHAIGGVVAETPAAKFVVKPIRRRAIEAAAKAREPVTADIPSEAETSGEVAAELVAMRMAMSKLLLERRMAELAGKENSTSLAVRKPRAESTRSESRVNSTSSLWRSVNQDTPDAEKADEADGLLARISRKRQPLRVTPAPQYLRPQLPANTKSDAKANGSAGSNELLFVDRRLADRRGGEAAERVREQQATLNETVLSMRKGGTALIALNAVFLVIVVGALFLWWRMHPSSSQPSQSAEAKELQKAAATQMAEMRKALQTSELAAYAACLGNQTARNMLMQMKSGAAAPQLPPTSASMLQTVAATTDASSGAQIKFDLDDAATMNAHLPVLFHLGVQNVGSSTALNAKVWGAVKVLDVAKDPDFQYDEVALAKKAISPGEPEAKVVLYTTESGMVVPLKETEYQQVTSGEAYVVAYGRVVYEDLWGVRRWTEFCHYITEPAGVKSHSSGCLSYNGSGLIRGTDRLREREKRPMNAEVALPAIACVEPKGDKF